MALGGFFNKLLGGKTPATISDDPFGSKVLPSAVVAPPPPPRPKPAVLVQRNEILDGRSRIAGYRFVAHRMGSGLSIDASDSTVALASENVANFAQRRLAMIPLSHGDWLAADFRQFIAPHTVFVVLTPPPGERDAWLTTLQEIKAAGGRIGLDGVGANNESAIALADLVLVDFVAYTLEGFEKLVKGLAQRHPNLAIAADAIGSWTEYRLCQSYGVRYCLGGFATTTDEEAQGEALNQSRLVLIEMLNLLRRDAEAEEIAAVAKRDPGVAVKVIGMANSPMSGLSAPVASIEQAMLVLGRDTLYRWLSLAMFRSGGGSGRDEALLELALCRGRFLELVAAGSKPKKECDELFLVGLLSLLDSLLGMPMAKVVEKMHLPPAVADVLVRSEGPYGRYLMLTLSIEKGFGTHAEDLARSLGIPADRLEEANRAARAWAEEALQAS